LHCYRVIQFVNRPRRTIDVGGSCWREFHALTLPKSKLGRKLADELNPMTESGSQPDLSSVEYRLAWLTRLLGIGVLALVGVTWKLWTPQDVFPRVPLFRWAPPDWWDWTSLGLVAIGGLGLGVGPARFTRPFATTLAAGLAIAFLCDQHRLQPWAWQFFILALLIALADKPLQWHGWQWLTISIYFYSALSKFDAQFMNQVGLGLSLDFTSGMVRDRDWTMFGSSLSHLLEEIGTYFFPFFELGISIALARSAWRKYGFVGAFLMHGLLLWRLGPLGFNHSWGVLLWNLWLIPHACLLFIQRGVANDDRHDVVPANRSFPNPVSNGIARAALIVTLIWPSFTPFGFCDFWPGWVVYVWPYESGWVNIALDNREEWPQTLTSMGVDLSQDEVIKGIGAGEWSLTATGTPRYPNIRTDIALALEIGERIDGIKVFVDLRRRDRWTMLTHSVGQLNNLAEIHAYARRFWFNAYPTSMYRRAAKNKMMNDDG
jgi:hypothetical protein